MKIEFIGIDTFSFAECSLIRTVRADKEEVFKRLDLSQFKGKIIKHTENNIAFNIEVKEVRILNN